jgi:alpha-amylase
VLTVEGAVGDANLRADMNWADTATARGRALLDHWRTLGQFRARHAAVGAGGHIELNRSPLVFARVLGDDIVVVALGPRATATSVSVAGLLTPGTVLRDAYGGGTATVGADGRLTVGAGARPVLYELRSEIRDR